MDARRLYWRQKTEAWILVVPSKVNSMELGAQEWSNAIFMQYDIKHMDLTRNCEIYSVKFSISHTLDCKKGCLVTSHHNKLHERVVYLAIKGITPTHMCNNHMIHPG